MSGFNSVNQGFLGGGGSSGPGPATTVPISGLLAAESTNSINNASYTQTWAWNTLDNATGLALTSSTTAGVGPNVLFSSIINGVSTGTHIAASFSAFGAAENIAVQILAGSLNLGKGSVQNGIINIFGSTSGNITIQPQAAAGTYNFNLPANAGTAGQVLTSGGGAGAPMTWNTPAAPSLTLNEIAYGGAGNVMTSNEDFYYDPNAVTGKVFNVGFGGFQTFTLDALNDIYVIKNAGNSEIFILNPAAQTYSFGDINQENSGGIISLDDATNVAYYDNFAHTGKFGINTSAPSVALDVVGTVNASTGFNGTVGATTPSTGAFTTVTATTGTFNTSALFGTSTSGVDHIQITASNGSGLPEIKMFNSGVIDARLTTNGTSFSMNTGLDVNGTLTTTGTFKAAGLASTAGGFSAVSGELILAAASGSPSFINFTETGAGFYGALGTAQTTGDLVYYSSPANSTTFGGTERLRIKNATGNVGIGTISPTSTLHASGSFAALLTATATGLTAGASTTYVVTATGQTITLPTAVGIKDRIYTIKLSASGSATVATTSSQTIDGSTTYSLASQYKYVTVQSDNANWQIIGNN